TFRYDIEQEADIAEEIARIYGYDNIPMTIPKGANSGKKNQLQKSEELLKTAMVAQGYSESLSYAFESPRVYEKLLLDIDNINPVRIINPLGEDYSVMRTTVIPSMLNSLALNFNRRNESAALFEITKIYKPSTEKPEEYQMLAMGCYGNTDFFDMKGAIENIFETFGIMPDFVPEINISYMHPGKTATIICNDVELGYFGEVHPKVLENYGISATVYAGEIKINEFFHHANTAKSYVPLPKFPGISRDIALIVKEDITAAAISNEIRNNGGKFLKDVRLFDVFRGDALPEGCKSMALRLSFRADERTLKDEEIIKTMEKILKALEISLDAKLR
ncbi:MAG: phenylalanine--tRNA ligase subunit beta, partial [Defluviitaleaceae bacterium]|nr:phenylalanine--tRNA ligase subunit beta [Defluviitaleaceae bacterium]